MRRGTLGVDLLVPGHAMTARFANRLLDALPEIDRARWADEIDSVSMRRGQVLDAPDVPSAHAWFPATAAVSIQNAMQDGHGGEIALVGNEGVIGRLLPPGLGTARCRAVVCGDGSGYRIDARRVLDAFERGGALTRALLRFTEALIAQMAQLIVCTRHHRLDQQLSRLLLDSLSRSEGTSIGTTHDALAARLGVRRESVTTTLRTLSAIGLVEPHRGRLTVLDRAGLERRSCECHAVIAAEYRRLLR